MGQRELKKAGERGAEQSAALTSPFTDAHAIVFADFGLSVRKSFTKRQLADLREAISGALPQTIFRPIPKESCGGEDGLRFGFERLAPGDGSEVIEELHVHASHVHLMFHEYRGWATTRINALERLAPILKVFQKGSFGDARLILAYRDAFVNKQPERYSALDVFKPNKFLPMMVIEAGEFWHQQLTLVEEAGPKESWERIFSRLTIEARVRSEEVEDDGESEDRFVHWTEITHRQQLAGNSKAKPAVEWAVETVGSRLDAMHSKNKAVILELLSHEMAGRIGLMENVDG
ncbi:hypothetical protein LMG19146_03825 [Xanthomonas arboricola pv. fragariae]|uniref:hypothetical protein n=1 Tax=Xanthomonas arboricola TaxID=56448 RepID=UPI000C836364|nr:hypothetical protein [Xanthomonas arboricola]SOU04894.1 hypothetical protein LMG19146_03825 [Xanthomonas arboricola pv. fragariae]